MNHDSWPVADAGRAPQRRRPEWMTQILLPVTVSVLGTLAVTALTPVGESVRELLFPTKAAVSGTVVLEGQPAAAARLTLDDRNVVTAGEDGGFLLPKVGDGEHRLHVEALGTRSRDWAFTVDKGETKVNVGSVELQPLVRLGYAAVVQPPRPAGRAGVSSFAAEVPYDVTLWIQGNRAALSKIKKVSYTLPAPLPTAAVTGGAARDLFCYRQAGTVSFQDLFVLGGAFAAAAAEVDLGDRQPFQILGQPGASRPPNCVPHRVNGGSAEPVPAGGGGPVTISPPNPVPTAVPAPMIAIPDVTKLPSDQAQATLQSLGFTVQVVRQASTVEKDKVIGTQPAAGSRARRGSTVKLLVSTGPTQVELGCEPGGSAANLSVAAGTEVLFKNNARGTTNYMKVTFGGTLPGSAGIDPGRSFAQKFVDPGSYGYRCTFYEAGEQIGTIQVLAG